MIRMSESDGNGSVQQNKSVKTQVFGKGKPKG